MMFLSSFSVNILFSLMSENFTQTRKRGEKRQEKRKKETEAEDKEHYFTHKMCETQWFSVLLQLLGKWDKLRKLPIKYVLSSFKRSYHGMINSILRGL